MTAATDSTDIEAEDTTDGKGKRTRERTRGEAFIMRVAAEHRRRATAQLRHWQPGTIDPAMIAITRDATPAEYPAWALTAKLFVTTNTQSPTAKWYGFHGNGIGRWAFWAKPRQGSGKPDPQMERMIAALTRATTFDDVAQLLTGLARATSRTTPDWRVVLADLTEWCDPSRRDAVRYRWAQGFYTPTEAEAKDTATDETTAETETETEHS